MSSSPRPFGFPETPGEDDRESDFIELLAAPVGGSVDPEVLRKAAVGLLSTGEIDQRAACRLGTAAGEHGGGRLHHVARPHEMIAAHVVVAAILSPGDGGGGNKGSGVGLVLVRQKHVVAGAHAACRHLARAPRATRGLPRAATAR